MLIIFPVESRADEDIGNQVNDFLADARIDDGVETFSSALESDPGNNQIRFALGFMQFADAVENLGRAWYHHGLRSNGRFAGMMPFLRLPVPVNPEPEPIDYRQARSILEDFTTDLMRAEATLAGIDGNDLRLGLHLGQAHLDFNGDGTAGEDEALWHVYATLNRRVAITAEQADDFFIRLDTGDVYWLRGYCHLLSGILEFHLSHDSSKLFDHTAHLYFSDPVQPYPFLQETGEDHGRNFDHWMDLIALIHLIDLPVTEPERNTRALAHFQQVIELSRASWDAYMAETDDDHEWIPNSGQTGVVPNVEISEEMITQWRGFLDEAEKILAGELLIPFWRGTVARGVNLRRFLLERERLDLVLWIQGTAATPFLEDGELTRPEFWGRLNQSFSGRFLGFALWFN